MNFIGETLGATALDDAFCLAVLAVSLPLVLIVLVAAIAYGLGVRSVEATA